MPEKCIICGKEIKSDGVRCSICSRAMHKKCIDEEALCDAYGNYLCPSCAAISALEWFDLIISLYGSKIEPNKKSEIINRLTNYIRMLSRDI